MQKLSKAIVTALLSKQVRHPFKVQILKAKNIILICQSVSDFPLEIVAPGLNCAVESCKSEFCLAPVVGTALFAGQRPAKSLALVVVSFQKQRSLYIIAIAGSKEYLHAEIESRAFTRRESASRLFPIRYSDYPEISAFIPFDGDGLYPSLHFSGLVKSIAFLPYSDLVAIESIPGLGKRKGFVLSAWFERRRSGLDRMLKIAEKQQVCLVNAPCNVLHCLAGQLCYPVEALNLFQFNNMVCQRIDVDGLFEYPVVSPVQSNAMIVQASKLVYLTVQMTIPGIGIQFVLVCNHGIASNHGLRFWFSMYPRTTSNDTPIHPRPKGRGFLGGNIS